MDFLDHTDLVPTRSQRVPQNIETPVTFVSAPGAYIRYAYSRSSDSIVGQIEGQDYLCFQHNDQKLVFLVCDGVGSSFCGNLAARILGDGLLEWLWLQEVPRMGSSNALREATAAFLNRLQKQAQIEVAEYEIPDHITGLIRQALESQRDYGSEAVFVACRIDHPSPSIPDGLISIVWMGDTRVRVLRDKDGSEVDLGGDWGNANRWSSTQGVRGSTFAWMSSLAEIGRVAAFTDGLSAHYGHVLEYSDTRLNREIRDGAKLPSSDDVAFVDVVLRTPQYEGYPDFDIPDPNAERPHLEQVWNPTGAGRYTVRWGWPSQQKASFLIQEALNPALTEARIIEVSQGQLEWQPPEDRPPGVYYYRLRAVTRWGTVTPWSELRQTRVAFPPPPAPVLAAANQDAAGLILSWSEAAGAHTYMVEYATDEGFAEGAVAFEGSATSWTIPVKAYRPGGYYFRVRAVSDGGEGPYSETRRVEIIPPAPPRPQLGTISYDQSRGTYLLRWQHTVGSTRYEVEEHFRPGDGAESTAITSVEDALHAVAIDDKPVGEYTYKVRACNEFTCSEWSNEQIIIIAPPTPTEAPALEADLDTEAGIVRLHWSEVAYATEYTLEMSDNPAFFHARMFSRTDHEMEIGHREPGARYFRVCAANSGGNGPWSTVAEVTVLPPKPAWIEIAPGDSPGKLQVSWGSVGGRITYCAEIVEAGDDKSPGIEIYRGEDTHVAAPIPSGIGALMVRVRTEAGDTNGEWQYSDPVIVDAGPEPPDLNPPEQGKDGSIQVTWQRREGASYYRLEISREPEFATVLEKVDVQEIMAVFNPPGAGTYYFRIHACDPDGCGPASEPVSLAVDQPGVPRLWPIDTVKAHEMFEISWQGVPGCAYYECQQGWDDAFSPGHVKMIKVIHPSQKIAFPGQLPGRYFIRVRAFDERNHHSPWSNVIVVAVE